MERSTILDLKKPVWVDVPGGDGLRCQVILSEALATSPLMFGPTAEGTVRDVCERLFVAFEGYVEDGKPVENTVEHRMELYNWPPCRTAINARVNQVMRGVTEGNEGAASE